MGRGEEGLLTGVTRGDHQNNREPSELGDRRRLRRAWVRGIRVRWLSWWPPASRGERGDLGGGLACHDRRRAVAGDGSRARLCVWGRRERRRKVFVFAKKKKELI